MKVFTLRMNDEQAKQVAVFARMEGLPQSEWIRQAVDAHIRARAADPEFQERLRELREHDERVFQRLSEWFRQTTTQ